MAEVTEAGYQTIRDFIEGDWVWVELRDDTDTPIIRIDEPTDPRVTWTHSPGAQVLELQVELAGSDADIEPLLPQTFQFSALFNVSTGGDPLAHEEFTAFTISTTEDQLTVFHELEVPEVI